MLDKRGFAPRPHSLPPSFLPKAKIQGGMSPKGDKGDFQGRGLKELDTMYSIQQRGGFRIKQELQQS